MANTMSREAFEAWLNPGHHAGNVSPWVEPGRYQKDTHQLAWLAWQAAQADAYERAAKVCHEKYMEFTHGVDRTDPTDDWEWGAKSDVAKELREDIRALAKESSK
jgi:hypothetical protein